MSEQDKTGGPAFPVEGVEYGGKLGGQLHHGMSLRDYFAAKAMQGDLANASDDNIVCQHPTFESAAEIYYRIADAMLKVREA